MDSVTDTSSQLIHRVDTFSIYKGKCIDKSEIVKLWSIHTVLKVFDNGLMEEPEPIVTNYCQHSQCSSIHEIEKHIKKSNFSYCIHRNQRKATFWTHELIVQDKHGRKKEELCQPLSKRYNNCKECVMKEKYQRREEEILRQEQQALQTEAEKKILEKKKLKKEAKLLAKIEAERESKRRQREQRAEAQKKWEQDQLRKLKKQQEQQQLKRKDKTLNRKRFKCRGHAEGEREAAFVK